MPISLLLGASEADVVSSCRDVRGVKALEAYVGDSRFSSSSDDECRSCYRPVIGY